MSADNGEVRNPRQERTFTASEIESIVTQPPYLINEKWRGKDLISIRQCSANDINMIIDKAAYFEKHMNNGERKKYCNRLKGYRIMVIFTQQSLRTYSKF